VEAEIDLQKTRVIGLGNPILTDDGVGVKVAMAVERRLGPEDRRQVDVTEASVGGLRLMEMMIGYDRVILIDALTNGDAGEPGAIRRLTLDDLRAMSPTQHSACAHDTTLVTALAAGRKIGLQLPSELVIFAVEVENTSDFSDTPTPAVAAAIPRATAAVLGEIVGEVEES
jgi:hydrogenase maturation protease